MAFSTQPTGSITRVWDITADSGQTSFTDWQKARCLIVDTASTIDGTTWSGDSVTGFPLVPGYNPIRFKSFSNLTGATVLWAGD